MEEAAELQEEEIETLEAIYGEELQVGGNPGSREVTLTLVPGEGGEGAPARLALALWLPATYPLEAPPQFGLSGGLAAALDEEHIATSLAEQWSEAEESGVIWTWAEWLREFVQPFVLEAAEAAPEPEPEPEPQPEPQQPAQTELQAALAAEAEWEEALAAAESSEQWADIVSGEPLIDRKSVFQAHLTPCNSQEDVRRFGATLRQNKKIAVATHNIMAYRIKLRQPSAAGEVEVLDQDCDDDGESAAGGRLLQLLEIVGAENVCVVVSRWYGGIHLGPDRFKDINNVARALLEAEGYIAASAGKKSPGKRKKKKKKR